LGVPLTLAAWFGLVWLAWQGVHKYDRRGDAVGLLLWLGVTSALLMFNPLPWQRYYLPLMPIMVLMVGISSAVLGQGFCKVHEKVGNTLLRVRLCAKNDSHQT